MPGATFELALAFAAFGVRVSDGAMTADGSNPRILTSPTAAFTTQDVGKAITVDGAGAAGADLETRVRRLISATEVELADPALTTVAAADISYATGVYRLSEVLNGPDIDENRYQFLGKLRRLQIQIGDDSPGGSLFIGGPYVTPDNYGLALTGGDSDDYAPGIGTMAIPSGEYVCSDVANQLIHLYWSDETFQSTPA